ncbi:hypothetical protein [Ochrobactrum quorumnocens]|uniref:hypothetical protein n=1 Tax=Ochrobactrum quorumnocens TaxID=271865 RepID=UPI003BA1B029
MTKSKPLLSRDVFIEQHQALETKIFNKKGTPTGQNLLSEVAYKNLFSEGAKSLKATNRTVRIEFATEAHERLSLYLKQFPRTRLSFVTLTPLACCVPTNGDHQKAIEDLQILLYEQFGGFSFYGFIEPGLFADFPITLNNKKTVSWHVHMLVWEDYPNTFSEITGIIDQFNNDYEALIPGKAAGHLRSVNHQQALKRVWYMSKAPLRDIHVFRARATGAYKSKKRLLRPGQAILLHNIMSDMSVVDLCVSNFSGDEIAEGTKLATIATVERREQERYDNYYRRKKRR